MIRARRRLAEMTVGTGEQWIGSLINGELRVLFCRGKDLGRFGFLAQAGALRAGLPVCAARAPGPGKQPGRQLSLQRRSNPAQGL